MVTRTCECNSGKQRKSCREVVQRVQGRLLDYETFSDRKNQFLNAKESIRLNKSFPFAKLKATCSHFVSKMVGKLWK